MESSSSSSSSSYDSSQSSSESNQIKGFKFNGTVYPTYKEMVAAKRERNQLVLKQKMSEVASFAPQSTSSHNSDTSVEMERKQKRGALGKKKSSEPVSHNAIHDVNLQVLHLPLPIRQHQ
jgi:hypothetical protein